MKILIIGGNRFFGKKLTAGLLQDRHQVTLLNRGRIDDGFGDRIERIKCDRRNTAELQNLLKDTTWDLVYDQVCFDADEAKAACDVFAGKTPHYIFTSSMSVYDLGADLKEAVYDPHAHKFTLAADPKKEYAEAKRQCEAVFFQTNAFPVTAVRFPIVVGADDYTKRFQFHTGRIRNSEPIYFPAIDSRMSMIWSDDAAAALKFLGHRRPAGPVNAASAEPIAIKDFIKEIEKISGQTANLTDAASDQNHSPYGIGGDWFMNTDKLNELGFRARAIGEWLPGQIAAVL